MFINSYISAHYTKIASVAFWFIFLLDAFAENNVDFNDPDSTNISFIHFGLEQVVDRNRVGQ